MVKVSQEEKEKARVALCGGLNEAYIHYRALCDLPALQVIAFCYRQCGMPTRAREILAEVSTLTVEKNSTSSGGIIESDVQSLANGGPNEIPPVETCIGVPAGAGTLCLQPG